LRVKAEFNLRKR